MRDYSHEIGRGVVLVYIITKTGGSAYGRTRAEMEDNLRKDGLSSLSEEDHDKCKYLERKSKEELGGKIFINQGHIDKTESIEE